MEKYERMLRWVAMAYIIIVAIMGGYFYLKQHRECSSDGYVLSYGQPVYYQGVPVRCKRLPL